MDKPDKEKQIRFGDNIEFIEDNQDGYKLPKLTIAERLGVNSDRKFPNVEKYYNPNSYYEETNEKTFVKIEEFPLEQAEQEKPLRKPLNLKSILDRALGKKEISEKTSLLKLKIGDRLNINRQTELLQSFVRGNEESQKPAEGIDVKLREKLRCLVRLKTVEFSQHELTAKKENENKDAKSGKMSEEIMSKETEGLKSPESRPRTVKITEKALKMEMKKWKKRKTARPGEIYTDKDRAAAVNMGSKDIKHSLKLKKRKDRFTAFSIPEEAEPEMFLALANYEMGRRGPQRALNFINKALELNPLDKNALVARSRCHTFMGNPEKGLKDAEAALAIDKQFVKAIFQKAESLYHLGDFEHSLMYFHRGLKIRPDNKGFQLGVKKAQKAIENAIGGCFPGLKSNPEHSNRSTQRTDCSSTKKKSDGSTIRISDTESTVSLEKSRSSRSTRKSNSTIRSKSANPSRQLLRELKVDKEYLNNLLINPNIKCKHQEDNSDLISYIKDTIDFLDKRQEFWRQQLPMQFKH